MNSSNIGMIDTTQEVNYQFSFDPFCIELSLATQEESNWMILQTVSEIMNTMLRLKDRGPAFHEELFELVAQCLLSPLVARDKIAWGIIQPTAPYIRYATPVLIRLLQQENINQQADHLPGANNLRDILLYRFLLQKCYGWQEEAFEPIYLPGNRSAQVVLDSRFLEVSTAIELPPLAHDLVRTAIQLGQSPAYLRKQLPLHRFQFEGFACIQISHTKK